LLAPNSIFAYRTFLFLHTLGMAMVAGVNAAIDLGLLGLAPTVPIRPLARLYPVMWWRFGINLFTCSALLIADATTKFTNPDFYVKMTFVFGGIAILALMRKRIFGYSALDKAPLPSTAKLLAWISLTCWIGAVTCGRLLAYWDPSRAR
jgi:hypothetical protein